MIRSSGAGFWRMWTCGLALGSAAGLVLTRASIAETGRASFYGAESGRTTASGARFHPDGLTAAHRSLPFGTRLHVALGSRAVVVTITDRGPAAWTGRVLDLSHGAARLLGMQRRGVAIVHFDRLN